MGKQKRLIKELEHALAQMEQDWRNEHENAGCLLRSLMRNMSERATERKRHNMIVDAMAEGVNRVVGERDAALEDVETLTEANAEADATIGELRALVEQQRKDWSGDVEASREIIARKTEEYIKLRRDAADTISDLRGDLAEARGDLERVTESWQHAEDLLQERERELDALQEHARQWDALCFRLGIAQASHIDAVIAAAQAQQEHAEPVVTLQAIEELEEGEWLIEHDRMVIEAVKDGYIVWEWTCEHIFKTGPGEVYRWYLSLPQP